MPLQITVSTHPLAAHLVSNLRDARTAPAQFRGFSDLLTVILALDATRDLATRSQTVNTPLEPMDGTYLASGIVVVPILRAGIGMLQPILNLFPDVSVGYIGLERNHATALPSAYYEKLPNLRGGAPRPVLIVDPMLATGGSSCKAIEAVKNAGGTDIRLVCVVAAPEGVETVNNAHPDVPIFTAALDRELNDVRYILPGLGDYGDRLFGTL